ncbi:MAG: histidine phosphatase family protein [Hyphomonadaceae bacterium]
MVDIAETRLLLIRHSHAVGQEPESPLTGPGVAAAKELAEVLSRQPIDAIYSSPYKRALTTMQPLAAALGRTVKIDRRLQERRLAATALDDWRAHVLRSYADEHYAPEGGESIAQVRRRALGALSDIAANKHTLPAICTHGQFISAVLATCDPNFGYEDWLALRNPHVIPITMRGAKITSFRLA